MVSCLVFEGKTDQNLVLAAYKVLFLVFVCITGFAVLGGARVGGKKSDQYGKENFASSFREETKTTPYSYAKSLLSILYAFRGWYKFHIILIDPQAN